MPIRAVLPAAAAAAVCLAALFAGFSAAPGHEELRWSPVTVGLTLVVAIALAEAVRWLCRWSTARALTTLASSAASIVVLLSLRLAFFTPAASRPVDTWRQWPVSTAVNLMVVTVGFVVLAAAGEAAWRMMTREARSRRG
jgi:hypothetical protein